MLLLLPILAAGADVYDFKPGAERLAAAKHAARDLDHDGYVTYEELRQATIIPFLPKGGAVQLRDVPDLPMTRAAFAKDDTDHDGRLSLAEAIAAADRSFDEEDANHDGKLDTAERGAAAVRIMQELQAETAALPHPACQPGAACATMRHD